MESFRRRQVSFPFLESARPRGFTVYVRTSHPPRAMFNAVRRIVQELDPNLPVGRMNTVSRQVSESVRRERMVATLSGIFGAVATLLAVVGLYGVLAFTVTRRTREIGVRIALGAQTIDVAWMVVREVLAIAAAGVVMATVALAILAVVSLLAGLVPSWRAATVEPTAACATNEDVAAHRRRLLGRRGCGSLVLLAPRQNGLTHH